MEDKMGHLITFLGGKTGQGCSFGTVYSIVLKIDPLRVGNFCSKKALSVCFYLISSLRTRGDFAGLKSAKMGQNIGLKVCSGYVLFKSKMYMV